MPAGVWGLTDWSTKTVTLDKRLGQAQRRSAIAHETEHILRGPAVGYREREELAVEKATARKLIDIKDLGEALAWSQNLYEVADDLWVDSETVEVRLKHLHPSERAYLLRRLEDQGE